MRRRRPLLVIVVALAASLTACAAGEPDWDAAQNAADAFVESSSPADGALGAASGRMPPGVGRAPGEGITLTFPESARIDGVELVCFGGGAAVMSVEAEHPAGSSGLEVEVRCDGESTRAGLPEPRDRITAVTVDGELSSGAGAVFAAVVTGEVG